MVMNFWLDMVAMATPKCDLLLLGANLTVTSILCLKQESQWNLMTLTD